MGYGVVKVGVGLIGVGSTEKDAREDAQAVAVRSGAIATERFGALSIIKLSDAFIGCLERQGRYYRLTARESAQRFDLRARGEQERAKRQRKEARDHAAGLIL